MNFPILYIFGASGSGTTTLGRAAAEALGWRHFDVDDYYWLPTDPPYTTARLREERLPLLLRDADGAPGMVLTGWGESWVHPLIPSFTLAVRLVLEPSIRLARLEARERANFGSRLDPGGDMHDNHREFMDWAAKFDTGGLDIRSRASLDAWQVRMTCPVLTLDSADAVDINLARVLAALKKETAMERPMRRIRQQLEQAACEDILTRNTSGVLALSGDDGYPYAVPLSYVWAEGKLIFHGAKAGHKLDAMRREPRASFCVIDADDVVPERFTTHYRSVICFGRMRVVEEPEEMRRLTLLLCEKYWPGHPREGAEEVDGAMSRLCVFVMDVERVTGKQAIELVEKET